MSCGSKEQKETVMVLKVNLGCEKCYKKVKRVLCKFPQIRNQVYDKKNNTVTITVLCCSPEKIREKLCCKAGKSIKGIEIKQQSKESGSDGKTPANNSKNSSNPPGPSSHTTLVSICCGRPGPPCYHACPPYPDGYCVLPCPPPYYGYRCDCFCEEYPAVCSVM